MIRRTGSAGIRREVANGAHALRARARDTAGNVTTSGPVMVNVANTDYFQNEILATGFDLPTTLEFLPDGRMLVGELAGRIDVLPPPYTTPDPTRSCSSPTSAPPASSRASTTSSSTPTSRPITTSTSSTRGHAQPRPRLALHRQREPHRHRARQRGHPLRGPEDANAEHHGGSLNFANDGTLLFTTGEHFDPGAPQLLTSPRGKVHRINPDGTSRPTTRSMTAPGPNVDSVWARGLRNPYRAYYDAPTGRYYIADVGGNDPDTSEEEIDLGVRGANYGWPDTEGNCSLPCTEPAVLLPARRA